MKPSPHTPVRKKSGIHHRNKNNDRYDFPALIHQYPELAQYVFINNHGKETIDFSNPAAVRSLNKVLLHFHYHISYWELPPEFLCPPIPGRADYLHHLADLLASGNDGVIPRGNKISVVDIGTGANCIYPLIGHAEYGWTFVGSDTDPAAIQSAQRILRENTIPEDQIDIRQQKDFTSFFRTIIRPNEYYDLTMCNPPFHSSIEQATAGTRRKWKNLGTNKTDRMALNFGGKQHELVYPGGEREFVKGLAAESVEFAANVLWFSTLISKQSNIPFIQQHLELLHPHEIRVIEMSQGQKKSRLVAWTFHSHQSQLNWRFQRWQSALSD